MLHAEKFNIDASLRELMPHGSASFPMEVEWADFRRRVGGMISWHWHEDLQFFLISEGEVEITVGRVRHHLKEGEGLFVNSGLLHMSRSLSEGWRSAYYCLDFSPMLLSLFSGSIFEKKYVRPFLSTLFLDGYRLNPETLWQKEILDNTLRIAELTEGKEFGYEYKIVNLLTAMWLELLSHSNEDKAADGNRLQEKAVCSIITYINEHYSEKITLEEISEAVHKSQSECCRLFKLIAGRTIFQYLEELRIEKATILLKTSPLSVDQISMRTGFQSSSYFIKKFREKTGLTPLAFRKKG